MNNTFRFGILILSAGLCLSAQALQHKIKWKKVASGDTVYSLLKKHHFSPNQIENLLAKKVLPKSYTLSAGQEYLVKREGSSLHIDFFERNADSVYRFSKIGKDQSNAKQIEPKFDIQLVTVSGKVVGSILASIQRLIKDPMVGYQFMDAFVLNFELRKQVERGAPFTIQIEKKFLDGKLVKYGRILRASLEINGKKVHRRWVYLPKGGTFIGPQVPENRPFYSPVSLFHISSLFDRRRFHPVRRNYQPHLGVDFVAPKGHPVRAVGAGKVKRFGRNRASGKFVILKHPNGMESIYIHLSEIDKKIKKGTQLAGGEMLGKIGCTGFCTKAHLHFALKKAGRFVDPIKYLRSYPQNKKAIVEKKISLFKNSLNI